jgi:ParB-like chromosome segregation protein Spo0J
MKSNPWPAAKVVTKALSDLTPGEGNARRHSPEQIAQIATSIREWGWTIPVLIDEGGEVIAGHGRIEAARTIGIDRVPCVIARGWSESRKRAYRIADNRLAEMSEWDEDLLLSEISVLLDEDFDLDSIGLDDSFLDALKSDLAGFTPDAEPEAKREPVTPTHIERTRKKLSEAFDGAGQQSLLGVICPHCAEEFEVDIEGLKR